MCGIGVLHVWYMFQHLNAWSKFSNIKLINKPNCHMTQVKSQTLRPQSFQLFGMNVSEID